MLLVLASARSSDYLHFGSKSCPVLSLWRATHCEMLLQIVVARLHHQDLARKQKPIDLMVFSTTMAICEPIYSCITVLSTVTNIDCHMFQLTRCGCLRM
jgi:hypothetical protein